MKLYVNDHVLQQFRNRSYYSDFEIPEKNNVKILVQREKNGLEINILRGCIRVNDVNLVVNLYKNRKNGKVEMKALTVLSDHQMRISRNFGCGNYLKKGFKVEIDEVIFENKFFEKEDYEDYLKGVQWEESDVLSGNF